MGTTPSAEIGPFSPADDASCFEIYAQVVEDGGSFANEPPATREMFQSAWLANAAVFVARIDAAVAGSYYIRPNFPGVASHVANAGYMVDRVQRGAGLGQALLDHSLESARSLGYSSMMFNLVFEGNPARRLWERAGFEQIGRIPKVVGSEAALIYWREL